ncbi:MAG: MerR family transcriptional regulator [Ignavibacteriae bacterium]|nr:MerR family transcriptional regulator [Ignavibacteriota bacterium]MCB9207198.1 MerR family transcriptional regulator [Ignavibacteriales bacterium]MCB9210315.1 MerR family transcriptional regulator [Ignavibacteriales bacterium]MCB9219120.1 MerR family transcriptional regulator [Ignavibacteriales bacterium]MCB9259702.1 MerR family transcriptional regulator [Ignavibacteriales bacterium]
MNQDTNTAIYTISVAADILGISIHTLRMYEREGLILSYRKKSNQRLYSQKDLERIVCIQKTINEDKINIEGIRRVLALLPCWAIIKCSKKDRENCEFYSSHTKPCWMINHTNNICKDRNCRDCDVYQSFGSCDSIKNKLKDLLT